jgi:uncharacterized membrane-anchored protein
MSNGTIALILIFVAFFVFGMTGGKESKIQGWTWWIGVLVTGFIIWIVWSAHTSIIPAGGH